MFVEDYIPTYRTLLDMTSTKMGKLREENGSLLSLAASEEEKPEFLESALEKGADFNAQNILGVAWDSVLSRLLVGASAL